MARRNLQDLAALLQIYRQFSPEQKLQEELTKQQILASQQGIQESQANLRTAALMDPERLKLLQAQVAGANTEATFAKDTLDSRKKAIASSLDMTAEQIAALRGENAYNKDARPIALSVMKGTAQPQIDLLNQQVTGAKNVNSGFATDQRLKELQAKQMQMELDTTPQMQRAQMANQALQGFLALQSVEGGYNPNGTTATDLTKQEVLSALGGGSLPVELTPNVGVFGSIPVNDRNLFSKVQGGIIGADTEQQWTQNRSTLEYLLHNYPGASNRIFTPTIKRRLGMQ